MGAWLSVRQSDAAVRRELLRSLRTSAGSLTSPPLATAAVLVVGFEAEDAIEEYLAADIANGWGADGFAAAALERLWRANGDARSSSRARPADRQQFETSMRLLYFAAVLAGGRRSDTLRSPVSLPCPACGSETLPVWWSAFEPRPSREVYEDPSSQVLLGDATHACPACHWRGAPEYGTDAVIESIADLLIIERVRKLEELGTRLSTPGCAVTVGEWVRAGGTVGVVVQAADRGWSAEFPFVHWRLRRSEEYLREWPDEPAR